MGTRVLGDLPEVLVLPSSPEKRPFSLFCLACILNALGVMSLAGVLLDGLASLVHLGAFGLLWRACVLLLVLAYVTATVIQFMDRDQAGS